MDAGQRWAHVFALVWIAQPLVWNIMVAAFPDTFGYRVTFCETLGGWFTRWPLLWAIVALFLAHLYECGKAP